jgi:hypothetical protein
MRISRIVLLAIFCAGAVVAAVGGWLFASGAFDYEPLRLGDSAQEGPAGFLWVGAVHVHTDRSADASGTIEEIVAAATAADLDFVIVADHTTSAGAADRVETAWHDTVLVIAGEEISTDSGHLLALGLRSHPYALGPAADQALRDIEALGGVAFVAHPDGGESAWQTGWASASGLEIASLSSVLTQAAPLRLLGAALTYPWNADAAMRRFAAESWTSVGEWDRRIADGVPRSGIGSVDAHGPIWPLGFPSYEAAFRTLSTVVWMTTAPARIDRDRPRQPRADAGRVVEALAAGRAATIVGASGRADALVFVGWNAEGRIASPGMVVDRSDGPWQLRVGLGEDGPYTTELSRDGEVVAAADGTDLRHEITVPGAYRATVRRDTADDNGPWIVTNPIYVWDARTIAASRIHMAPPLPAPPIAEDLLALTGWAAEADPGSWSALAAGPGTLVWDLRVPNEAASGQFAALAWRPEAQLDWRGGGLVVQLESDREIRASLRLWTRDDAGVQRTWERVVRSGPEFRAAAAPWRSFRRIDRPGGSVEVGVPDSELARVDGIALVVTPQIVRPGTELRVQVLQLGRFAGAR